MALSGGYFINATVDGAMTKKASMVLIHAPQKDALYGANNCVINSQRSRALPC